MCLSHLHLRTYVQSIIGKLIYLLWKKCIKKYCSDFNLCQQFCFVYHVYEKETLFYQTDDANNNNNNKDGDENVYIHDGKEQNPCQPLSFHYFLC